MAHLRAQSVDSDLDDIWYPLARESGSADRADRFVASLTERFYLLSRNPWIGRSRDDYAPACVLSLCFSKPSFTASGMKMW